LDLCVTNKKVALGSTRKDLAVVWKLLEECIRTSSISLSSTSPTIKTTRPNRKGLKELSTSNFYKNDVEESDTPKAFKVPLACHPFGRQLVNSLIDHYTKFYDIQTAAMICCILGKRIQKHTQTLESVEPTTLTGVSTPLTSYTRSASTSVTMVSTTITILHWQRLYAYLRNTKMLYAARRFMCICRSLLTALSIDGNWLGSL
jgi:WD40 repeat protein